MGNMKGSIEDRRRTSDILLIEGLEEKYRDMVDMFQNLLRLCFGRCRKQSEPTVE